MAEAKKYLDKDGLQIAVGLLQTYADNAAGLTASFDSNSNLVVSSETKEQMSAGSILYTNSASPSGVTTVKEALDELYSLLINKQ